MNFNDITSRVTGFSIPIFGVEWSPDVYYSSERLRLVLNVALQSLMNGTEKA